ncbi:MAG: LysM peptidoglycan-binding domain-containing protein [Treponema sp.]|nr:LysM peptidoglycan-binding domain-containing protein [Spirochaetia bacterium]MDD7533242.1 LysM peptidoglycan-binding domain-containing protein [Treponema sp.]MDY3721198.1 LysM peptidoglycan-binding domain-containing protein [Treponema sp.]MDY5758301.1 LysM peptidoglycan-binding domain-containing protein [Treponema sp.]
MKTIGIKLADGSFYPVLEDNTPSEKKLELTTAHNNQTKVMVDLYRSATCSMDDAEYVDSLQIENLVARPNGEADIKFTISLDEDNQLSAKIVDSETGNESNTTITLVSRTLEERLVTDEYGINDSNSNKAGAVAAGEVAAGGLLAAAAAMREKVKDETEVEEEPVVENVDDGVPFGDETLVEEAAVEESVSNEEIPADETIIDETFADEALADDTITEDNSGLPDMDFDIPDDTTETETPEMPDDFFNTDDLDNTEERQETMKDPTFDSVSPAAGGLNFDGLYDEETERGTPAENGADEVKKKTKVPVIICIICAIICIIATLLILFIIPSKYNLITKKHAKEAGTTVSIEEPAPEAEPILEPEPEPVVPEAKEDEIIIIEKAEEVVPAQPPVAEEKPKNITYKIKWGDTLWDIADTYYKNPWKYKYIARYNGIKNPDYIISGTKIVIPAE